MPKVLTKDTETLLKPEPAMIKKPPSLLEVLQAAPDMDDLLIYRNNGAQQIVD